MPLERRANERKNVSGSISGTCMGEIAPWILAQSPPYEEHGVELLPGAKSVGLGDGPKKCLGPF
jgi:hypothetical protein